VRTWLGARAVAVEIVSAEPSVVYLRLARAARAASRRRRGYPRSASKRFVYRTHPKLRACEIEGLPLTEVHEVRFRRRKAAAARPHGTRGRRLKSDAG
jgi:hypothetical protein